MDAHRTALVGPLWFRRLVAFLYALASNLVLYSLLTIFGVTGWLSSPGDLLAWLLMPSLICAALGTVLFGLLRQRTDHPDPAFRLLVAGVVSILGATLVAAPTGGVFTATVALAMTGASLSSESISDAPDHGSAQRRG